MNNSSLIELIEFVGNEIDKSIMLLDVQDIPSVYINYTDKEDIINYSQTTDRFTINCIEQEGGEGQGESAWSVLKIVRTSLNDISYVYYIKAEYGYASYNGFCMDYIDYTVVESRKVVVDQWVPIEIEE